jgi:hypothetical protein
MKSNIVESNITENAQKQQPPNPMLKNETGIECIP